MKMNPNIIILLAALIATSAALLHPSPLVEQYSGQMLTVGSICNLFHFPSQHELINTQYYFNKISNRLNRNLQCSKSLTFSQNVHTSLAATQSVQKKSQAYEIIIDEEGIQLVFGDYSGYIYALETLSQLYSNGKLPYARIQDEPVLAHRGIMIDTARHFLKVSTIKKLIETMPQSKLNILHWHLADDQSFPIQLNSHPQLSQYGSFSSSKIYTLDDIKNLIAIADKNGVKIIPQIDTPAHMRSWVLSPDLKAKNLTISCSIENVTAKYSQIVNPSKPQALRLVQTVITELDDIFKNSPYIHLGGDLINFDCWNRADIATFKKLHNINSTEGLMQYWRFKLKQVLPTTRKIIYWLDHTQKYPTSDKDVLQYNGASADLPKAMANTQSKIILSAYDVLDLSSGLSNIWMNSSNGNYNGWKSMYENYTSLVKSVDSSRLLGAELLVWGSIANDDNFDEIVWMRAAIFGERVWTAKTVPISQLVASVTKLQKNFQVLGVNPMPLTGEFCQKSPTVCWPNTASPSQPSIQILIQ